VASKNHLNEVEIVLLLGSGKVEKTKAVNTFSKVTLGWLVLTEHFALRNKLGI